MRTSQADHDTAMLNLTELLHPGDTVRTIVTHVAPSGMTRWIRAFVLRDSEAQDISWSVAKVLGRPVNTRNHEGVECGGAGMDMGFELVYSLSRHLFREGFDCIQYSVNPDGTLRDSYKTSNYDRAWRCPSNDHANRVDPATLVTDDGKVRHTGDGGYALNQRWL